MDRAPKRLVWADGVLTLLSLCFQVGLSLLDIQQKFWAALFVWLVFTVVGIHLLWRVLPPKLRLIFIGLFAPATAWFVCPGLKRQGDKEHIAETLKALLHSIDERYLWMAGGALIAFAAISIGWVLWWALKRRIVGIADAPLGEEDQQRVTPPAEAEVPDDQVIPSYLDRLPGDQWDLLLGLNLGEKVMDLDAPGLGSLIENRLAQKLRRVEPNKYLFRLHPDNAKFVHARFSRPLPGLDRESFQQIVMAFPSCSEAIEYAISYTAREFLVPARGDYTKQLIVALLEGFPVRECKKGKGITDSELSLPAPPEKLIDHINNTLEKYGILVGYLERAGCAFLGEQVFYQSNGRARLFELHQACVASLSTLNRRPDLKDVFHLAALAKLLKRALPASGEPITPEIHKLVNLPISANDPRALWEWLSSLRTLPRGDAERELIGKEVQWEGELQSLSTREDDRTMVDVKVWIDRARRTYFMATVKRVPELEALDPQLGQKVNIIVAGKILLISLLERYIQLDSARAIF